MMIMTRKTHKVQYLFLENNWVLKNSWDVEVWTAKIVINILGMFLIIKDQFHNEMLEKSLLATYLSGITAPS